MSEQLPTIRCVFLYSRQLLYYASVRVCYPYEQQNLKNLTCNEKMYALTQTELEKNKIKSQQKLYVITFSI